MTTFSNPLKPRSSLDGVKKRSLKALFLFSLLAILYNAFCASPEGKDVLEYMGMDLATDLKGHNTVRAVSTAEGISTNAIAVHDERHLSIYLGNGQCKWQPPNYDTPEDIEFDKTLIVGYPSGDKRLTFVQMEALTGWSAKDEWDFEFLGMSNHPFIKANYPHHEGIWGWEDMGDQVIMVVRNIRRAMVEYHDILWDIGYAKTWADAFELIPNLYQQRPPLEDFRIWRDERVMDEVQWYGWFIDYWMESGLMRDIFTHNKTVTEHWNMLMQPGAYSRDELEAAFDEMVAARLENGEMIPDEYDPHCGTSGEGDLAAGNGEITDGCHPIRIISAELLVQNETGPAETRKIGDFLSEQEHMREYVIEEDAWDCIWTELIVKKKGLKTFLNRGNVTEVQYNFGEEMLEEMLREVDRLILKYGSDKWNWKVTAQDLVKLLMSHKELLEVELEEVKNGIRTLDDKDFLGPKERKRRKMERLTNSQNGYHEGQDILEARGLKNSEEHDEYFKALHRHLIQKRHMAHKEEVIENERRRMRNRQLNRMWQKRPH